VSGFEKDRSFYPTVLIVIGFLYVLFGSIDGRGSVVMIEGAFAILFSVVALIGFRNSGAIVGFGIVAHGLFDFVHGYLIEDAGVPVWWPGFCGSVDVLLGIYVVVVSIRNNSDSRKTAV
jgi:hypothetical protein